MPRPVQDVLDAQRKSGERNWRHHHYLRGSGYCSECQGRLIYTRASGNDGVYEYFVCRGRQEGTCTQPHHRVRAVELAIEEHYADVQLTDPRREQIRDYVRSYVAALDEYAAPERSRVSQLLRGLDGQERKLLAAHYAEETTARPERTPTAISTPGGSNVEAMVRPRGLEPPRGNPPPRPQTLPRPPSPPPPRGGGNFSFPG